MHRCVFPLLVLLAFPLNAHHPSREARGTVQGTVRDAATGAPLENTNVYLSSTTLGTATDSAGRFMLGNIPPGAYQLVASRVGYRVGSKSVVIGEGGAVRADMRIEAVELKGEEVEVLARVDTEWRRMLGEFLNAFIGEGENAGACVLLNPEVLDFREDANSGRLTASTDSVLRIENRALGYRLYARLGIFDWSVQEEQGRYLLYPRFEALTPRDSTEQSAWTERRARCYLGSLKHFLASLVAGKDEEEHFVIRTGTLTELQTGRSHPLAPEDIRIEQVPRQRFWKVAFDSWLRVDFRREEERRRSYIRLAGQPAVVDGAGNLVNPFSLEVIGDWTKSRVADMLPIQ